MAKTLFAAKKRTRIADKTNVAQNNRQLERVRNLAPSYAVKAAQVGRLVGQSARRLFFPAVRRGSFGIEVLNERGTERKTRITARAPCRSKERDTIPKPSS